MSFLEMVIPPNSYKIQDKSDKQQSILSYISEHMPNSQLLLVKLLGFFFLQQLVLHNTSGLRLFRKQSQDGGQYSSFLIFISQTTIYQGTQCIWGYVLAGRTFSRKTHDTVSTQGLNDLAVLLELTSHCSYGLCLRSPCSTLCHLFCQTIHLSNVHYCSLQSTSSPPKICKKKWL